MNDVKKQLAKNALLSNSVDRSNRLLSADKNERRSDWEVRKAIENIQSYFFSPGLELATLQSALSSFSDILKLDYGYCFYSEPFDTTLIEKDSNSQIITSRRAKNSYTSNKLLTSWVKTEQHVFTTKVYNANLPEVYRQAFGDEPVPLSLAFLPIVCNGKLVALFVLGFASRQFTVRFKKRIAPLLGSIVCALQSSFESPLYKDDIEDLVGKNDFLRSLIINSPSAVLVVKDEIIIVNNPSAIDLINSRSKAPQNAESDFLGTKISEVLPSFNQIFEWSNQPTDYNSHINGQGAYLWDNQTIRGIDGTDINVCLSVFRYSTNKGLLSVLQFYEVNKGNKLPQLAPLNEAELKPNEINLSKESELISNSMPVGLLKLSLDWRCEFANEKWCEYSGLSHLDTIGHKWIKSVHSEDLQFLLEDLFVCATFNSEIRREVRLISPLGNIVWVDFVAKSISDITSSVEGIVATVIDITERRNYSSNLKKFALTDSLTNLHNRAGLLNRLERIFMKRNNDDTEVSLAFLDLDGFKAINDNYGHDIGDDTLRDVANRIQHLLNTTGIDEVEKRDMPKCHDTRAFASRFGGDEFVLLFPENISRDKVTVLMRRLLIDIAAVYKIKDKELYLTASIGIAFGVVKGNSARLMLNQADKALYFAKEFGKNNIKYFDEIEDYGYKVRNHLISDLRKGLKQARFSLVYQPIVSTENKKLVGFEALLRFTSEEGKLILPDETIPELESSGLIIEVGDWVIFEACRQMASWIGNGAVDENCYISINVSPKQLHDEHLIGVIEAALIKTGLKAINVVIEVTESTLINNPVRAGKIVDEIRNRGVRVALDDFGTGYCSMIYLQKFAFDILKIEKAFTSALSEHSENFRIISAIVTLAGLFNLKVTAEGIEDESYIQMLNGIGIDSIQGYITSKPLKPCNVNSFLTGYTSQFSEH